MAAGTVQGCREVALKCHDAAISQLRLLPQVRRSTSNFYACGISWQLHMVECRHPAAGRLRNCSQFAVLIRSAFFAIMCSTRQRWPQLVSDWKRWRCDVLTGALPCRQLPHQDGAQVVVFMLHSVGRHNTAAACTNVASNRIARVEVTMGSVAPLPAKSEQVDTVKFIDND